MSRKLAALLVSSIALLLSSQLVAQDLTKSLLDESATFGTNNAGIAYTAGYSLVEQLGPVGKELDEEALIQGIRDALRGRASKYDAITKYKHLDELRELMAAAKTAAVAASGPKNLEESKEFLATNAKQPGTTVTKSGLQYRVLKAGSGPSPDEDDTVRVHYHGTFPSGKVFDSSVERDRPAEFPVKYVIAGWTEALKLMKVGDKWHVAIPPELAYGEKGASPTIGPNQTLVFEIELLEIVD